MVPSRARSCLALALALLGVGLAACTTRDSRQASSPSPASAMPVPDAPPAAAIPPAQDWPLWAYGILAPPKPGDVAKPQGAPGPRFDPAIPREEQLKPIRLEGSTVTYTAVDLDDWQHAPDWFPDTHGPVPAAITRGPASLGEATRACGFCHRIQGGGRPENAPVHGLPVAYFLRQIEDFRAGRRHLSDPRKPNLPTMIALAKALSDEEARAVAEFWVTQDGGPRWKVIEGPMAPPTRLRGNLFVKTAETPSEPIGERIVEVPEDDERLGLTDDPRLGYVAYVPPGSLARGRALVETGRAPDAATPATLACTSCHGPALLGLGEAPPIAGRSPSYLTRQLFDFRTGARNGTLAGLMKPVVARLDARDMMAISAYVASLPPTQ
jgi:cytochrome c553